MDRVFRQPSHDLLNNKPHVTTYQDTSPNTNPLPALGTLVLHRTVVYFGVIRSAAVMVQQRQQRLLYQHMRSATKQVEMDGEVQIVENRFSTRHKLVTCFS